MLHVLSRTTDGGSHAGETTAVSVPSVAWSCRNQKPSTDRHAPVAQFPSLEKLTDARMRQSAVNELEARLRCDYEVERAEGKPAATTSFVEWRQAALQRHYGPEWGRIDQSDLPMP